MTEANIVTGDIVTDEGSTRGRVAAAVGVVCALTAGGLTYNAISGGEDAGANTIEITAEDLEQFRITAFNEDACQTAITVSGTGAVHELLGPVPDYGFQKPVTDGVTRSQDTRLINEGLRNPMTTEDKLSELFTSICEDDLERDMVGHFLANLEIDDTRISDMDGNEWLKRYAVGIDEINDVALLDMPLFGHEGSLDPNNDELVDSVLEASARREDDAERIIELLSRLQDEGVVTGEQTVKNYRLAGAGLSTGVPEVEAGPEYTGDFLVFTARTKAGDCVLRLGFNIDDQRLAVLVCETPTSGTTVPGDTDTTGSDTTGPRLTTTTRAGAKKVYCITPNGPVEIVDANDNGFADEAVCNQLQNNGAGTPNTADVEGTTSTTAASSTTEEQNPPTTGPRPTIPPAPPTTGTPPPPTVPTIPPNPTD